MGGNFRLRNGLNKLSRVWPTRPRSKKGAKIDLNLMFLMIFKICSHFSENTSFRST